MTFQKTVLIIGAVLLILILLVISIALYRNKTTGDFPPVISDCPDYWVSQLESGQNICSNVKHLGKASCSKKMNFNKPPWNGSDSVCYKSKWAKACDLTWDGITNSNVDCKNTRTEDK